MQNKKYGKKKLKMIVICFIICLFLPATMTSCLDISGEVAEDRNVSDETLFVEPTFNFDKTYPKVFKAWNEAENFEGFSDIEKMAAYDLIFDCTYFMGAVWKISEEQPYASLSTELVDAESWEDDLSRAIEYKEEILELNENFKVLAQVYIREDSYVTKEEIESGLPIWEYEGFPLESEFWLLDEEGKHIPGWGEDLDADGILEEEEVETYLIDFTNETYQDLVVAKVVALYESQVFDGVFFDWWSEEHQTLVNYDYTESYMPLEEEITARVDLLQKIREEVPSDFLILVNTNYDMIPQSAPYVNGVYMECFKDINAKGISDTEIIKMETTLRWAEENLLEPRINCLEGWRDVEVYDADLETRIQERSSEENLQQMEMLTALVLTLSDGHILFSDNNAQPFWDHKHNYYDLWTRDLGQALGAGGKIRNHVYIREFEKGFVIYNGSSDEVKYEGYKVPAYSGYFDFYEQ